MIKFFACRLTPRALNSIKFFKPEDVYFYKENFNGEYDCIVSSEAIRTLLFHCSDGTSNVRTLLECENNMFFLAAVRLYEKLFLNENAMMQGPLNQYDQPLRVPAIDYNQNVFVISLKNVASFLANRLVFYHVSSYKKGFKTHYKIQVNYDIDGMNRNHYVDITDKGLLESILEELQNQINQQFH